MYALILCCSMEIDSLDTIFSYIFISLYNDTICVKTIAHWYFKTSNEIHGGFPPTVDDTNK